MATATRLAYWHSESCTCYVRATCPMCRVEHPVVVLGEREEHEHWRPDLNNVALPCGHVADLVLER